MEDKLIVNARHVSCDGGSIIKGHPRVYFEIGGTDSVVCPYCGKEFIYEEMGEVKNNEGFD